ncbi:MAG: AAA family ATPase [Burkholderiaceae bacterium]|nr:AAA family ATPase [Burkholderiaceae bacterium]
MAGILSADAIDFAAYMRETECKAKVRSARDFESDLQAEFQEPSSRKRSATMFSSKMRHYLEFRPGEVTCWAGYNGHRKSMFTGQVAAELCYQGEKVLIASMEMLPGRTLARMARQVNGRNELSRNAVSRFTRWTDGRLWLFDHMGRITPDLMLGVCMYFADEIKGGHLFIDSMMMVCASEESLDEQKQFVTDLVRVAQETGLHIHLVAHCRKPQDETKPPTKYDVRGSGAITDQSHNVVMVWANKEKKSQLEKDPHDEKALSFPDAAVTVEKQRNGSYEGRLRYWFDERSFRFTDERTTPVESWLTADDEGGP